MVILIVISFALEAFIIELYCRKLFTAKARLDKRLYIRKRFFSGMYFWK